MITEDSFVLSACKTGTGSTETTIRTSQSKAVGANGAEQITTTTYYYTALQQGIVSTSGKSVAGKQTATTNTATNTVVQQDLKVAALPKSSGTATDSTVGARPLSTVPVQSSTSGVPAPVQTKQSSVQSVTNTATQKQQGELVT